ncbi:tRNA preQ1(34) S-adenosylmethionine ribosyltransferase-isomerase QueA [Sessilibacter sp. MAH1]
MQRQDFNFDLPEALIASKPLEKRTSSRLLVLDGNTGSLQHRIFTDILEMVSPGDLMVFNNTKVIPARLFGKKSTGGQVEILIERITGDDTALAHVRSSRSPKPGSQLHLENGAVINVVGRAENLFKLEIKEHSFISVLEDIGHIPLPPYIQREDDESDRQRYQTVYSRDDKKGAVAAPTAGLHFDQSLLESLKSKGVELGFVTLHVGAGTFQPVKVEKIEEHTMHSEWIEVDEHLCEQVRAAKARGNRVIAVGTTSVRCLESASSTGAINPMTGDTNIFIYPGYEFKTVDAMVTNFHLPESTLIMLVSAFAGIEHTKTAYRVAIEEQYRFFSYGDAMFVTKQRPV